MNSVMQITKNQVAIENLDAYNDLYVQQSEMDRSKSIPFKSEITFENISFKFPKAKEPVLKNINFRFELPFLKFSTYLLICFS